MEKICFIICANNGLLLNECLIYIDQLVVPDGIEKEVITIKNAISMTAGYNEAMNASDAKYKVYLHQDTFIVNRNFIDNVISLFNNDSNIGMLGMVGSERLPADAIMWNATRVGDFYGYDSADDLAKKSIRRVESSYREVQVVDGFLMVTQYDIPWRDDILRGWDFYDVSQCLEFEKTGYKVVVPSQNPAWAIHKCGNPSLWNYEDSRQVVVKEYLDK